ncbi:MAG TPA: endolytic transglycosylase MltG [Pseudogracilibacillus sp.]|nr:endolytic transglycosylase MltG [Pseudogracilibacillus sp.]
MKKDNHNDQIQSDKLVRANEAKVVRKVVFFVISFLLLFFIITAGIAFFYVKSSLGAVDADSEQLVEVEIPIGSSSTEIAKILEDNGIIKDARVFRFYIKFKNELDFQAGQYTLSPSMTLKETISELQTGTFIEEPIERVTIPEGKTLEQIAQIFAHKLSLDEEEFVELAKDEAFIKEMMEQYPSLLTDEVLNEDIINPLEGYLFAGTYDIYNEESTPNEIISMMIERTNKLFEERVALLEEMDFSIHEILTLASVIERESKFSEDRPKVSQVYMNRLDQDMKLQSDITAFYGLQHKAVVTYEDVEVESPYNTYVISGLPVGPISSPSTESIDAVLEPEGKDFTKVYYFSRPSGETFYSDTLEEHNKIKKEYRHEWYELENEKENEKES